MGQSLSIHKHADVSGERTMKKNPQHDPNDPDSPATIPAESWPLAGVELTSPAPESHAFSRPYVENGMAEGWISVIKGNIVIHTITGDLIYRIVEPPGRHDDANELSGYRVSHEFKVALVETPTKASVAQPKAKKEASS